MKPNLKHLAAGLALMLLLPNLGWAAEPWVIFGLNHTPLEGAVVNTNNGTLVVRPGGGGGDEMEPGSFGVSIDLGEADSGLFGYLDASYSFQSGGNFMEGQVFGQLNGQPEQWICSLKATTIDYNGNYTVAADFSPLGASSVTYQVFSGTRLVATCANAIGPVRLSTYSEFAPWANPFAKLPDGSVAAIIQFSAERSIQLPGWDVDQWIQGDRIIILPENALGLVDFASRLDVWAGGGEDVIVITQEKLGMFNHGHMALGDSFLNAASGQLTVSKLHPENPSDEVGVSIDLEHSRQFRMKIVPQDLATSGATLVASAIASYNRQGGEFLGYAGVRNLNEAWQVFGEFSFFTDGLQLNVYRNDCLVRTVLSPTASPTVTLSGNPRVIGFDATADTGPTHPGIAMRFDQLTTFSMPDGSTVEGDQIRFCAANTTPVDGLAAFNLTWSNLTAVTITSESGPPTISLVDYFPEVTAPVHLKKFNALIEGEATPLVRSGALVINDEGQQRAVLSDRSSLPDVSSTTYSLQEDGLHFHGYSQFQMGLLSDSGLRLLPEEVGVGQSYFSLASFHSHDPAYNQDYPVEVSSVTTVAALDTVSVPAGVFPVLRLETAMSFSSSGATNVPTARWSTNWLAAGVGVVKFSESEIFADSVVRQRSGEMTGYAILNTPARISTANVGANVLLKVDVRRYPKASITFQKNGETIGTAAWGDEFVLNLNNVQEGNAGAYSLTINLLNDSGEVEATTTSNLGDLRVIPFSDAPPFLAVGTGSRASWARGLADSAVDHAGNVYLAGSFYNTVTFGTNTLASSGTEDIFLVKLDPAGNILWAKRAGGLGYDYADAAGVDAAGNVYLMGRLWGSASFDDFRLEAVHWPSIFVAKADPNGRFLWAVNLQGNGYQTSGDMAVDEAGNAYVAGAFNHSLTLGGLTLSSDSSQDVLFLTQLDPAGHFVWATNAEGAGPIRPSVIVLNGPAELYVGGSFWNSAGFGPFSLSSDGYEGGGFLARVDAHGHFLGVEKIGSAIRNADIDSTGNLYLAGEFKGLARLGGLYLTQRYGSGSYPDTFLAKRAPEGHFLWAKNSEHPSSYDRTPLMADAFGNVYQAGGFYREGTYGVTTYSSGGTWSSTVLTKRDAQGRLLWSKELPGQDDNYPRALVKDTAGNVYLAGEFRRSITLGETNLTTGQLSVFLVKMGSAVAPVITQQPQSQTNNVGGTASFTVAATGTPPLSYQWRNNGINIASATEASFTHTDVQPGDAGKYSVVVANPGGLVASDNVTLQVLVPDAGTLVFAATNYTLIESNTLVLVTVLRNGSTSAVATVDFKTVDGTATAGDDYWATAVSLRFAPGETLKTVAVPIVDGPEYEPDETIVLRLCNPGPGTVAGQPDTATMILLDNDLPGAPFIRVQPADRTIGTGESAIFSVVADGTPPLIYQWRKDGADIVDATNRFYTIDAAQLSDAGIYSVVVRNRVGEVTSSNATLTVFPLPDNSFVMFGLWHRPLGAAEVNTNGGTLVVTPRGGGGIDDGEMDGGSYGVSIQLGEADSGIFGYLDTYNSLNSEGNFMVGRVYGQLNGQPNHYLCSLGVNTIDYWNGRFEVAADFESLGASGVTYLVFNGPTLVATMTNASGPVRIDTFSESAPWANPFWKLPDGSVAAVVYFSYPRSIALPGWDAEQWVAGDRIIIRPENVSGVVDFASRVDVTAGGGEDLLIITQERLGVFNHGHKALGDSLLEAIGGELTVRSLHPENLSEEIGVSIGLEDSRHFNVRLQPQDLTTNGASLVASAVGSYHQGGGEFLGYAGVRNVSGALQVFANFAFFAEGLQLSVYRNDCLAGTVVSPTPSPTMNLSGNPRVIGFDAAADTGPAHSWLAVRLDQVTTFSLPDGSTLEGDQLRFQAASPTLVDRLMALNLTCSNLSAFTITGESGPQTISLVDYFPEVTALALFKKFIRTDASVPVEFRRSSAWSNADGGERVVLTDRYSETNSVSATYSFQPDGLHFHGFTQAPLELFGAPGLRVLPEEIALGQSYVSRGSFAWHDSGSGLDYPVEVSSVTSVAGFESANVLAGAFSVFRLETVTTFSGSGASNAPTAQFCTNWLAAGVGVVKFDEREVFEGGAAHTRSGELTDFVILTTPARIHTANVGANVVLRADLVASPSARIVEWRKDGAGNYGSANPMVLNNVQNSAAGNYSVVISLESENVLTNDVACLRVIPFSDTPPFWAASLSSLGSIETHATAVDGAGNVYLAGSFRGSLAFGTNRVASLGGEDIFLAKLDPSGRMAWVKTVDSTYHDAATALDVDASGNVYMAGTAGAGAIIGTNHLSFSGVFVTKLDPNGNYQWIAHAEGTAYQNANGLAVDGAGNQYLLGSFYNGTIILGTTTLTNEPWNYDLFLTKLDADGHFLWARQASGEDTIYPSAIVLDSLGGLYLTGEFYQEATLGDTTLSSGAFYRAGFLAKADLNGVFLWAQTLGTDAGCVALDSAGNAYLTGAFSGTARFGGIFLATREINGTGAFLAKVAPSGAVLWARNSEQSPSYYGNPLTVDSADRVYLAGGFYGEATFGGTTFAKPSSSSTVLSKLDAEGQTLWHKQITGLSDNYPRVLARDSTGNVYLAGYFRNQVVFGETNLSSAIPDNVFVVKITGASAPTITPQPQSHAVNLGETVTFNVTATGTEPLTFQWRKDGLNIPGAIGASHSIAPVQWGDRGSYSVVVKNAGGIATSAPASLQVITPDAGALEFRETSYSVVESNTLVHVTVRRTGGTSTVASVEFKTVDGTATAGEDYWTTVVSLRFTSGETLKTVAVPIVDNLISEPVETVLLRLCNPGAGAVVGQPDTATITIIDNDPPGLPVIRVQPVSRAIGVGAAATFSVVAQGTPPLLYQWRKGGTDIQGATNRIFVIFDAHFSDAGSYSVVVRNAAGEVASANATLTVLPLPVILVQPQSQTVPYGECVTFSVVATSSFPVVTQVFSRVSSGPNQDWYYLPGGGGGTLHIQFDFRADPDNIDVFAEGLDPDGYFLGSLTTNGSGLFTVHYGSTPRSTPGDRLAIVVTPQVEGGGDGWSYRVEKAASPLTYTWRRGGVTVAGAAGPTYTIHFANFLDAGEYLVVVSDLAGSVLSETVVLNITGPLLRVSPAPNGYIQLQWNVGDYRLEACEDLTNGQWFDVEGAYSGMILPLSGRQTFYRLRWIGD